MNTIHEIELGPMMHIHIKLLCQHAALYLGSFIDDRIVVKYSIDEEGNSKLIIDFVEEVNYTSYKLQYTDTAFINGISQLATYNLLSEYNDRDTKGSH